MKLVIDALLGNFDRHNGNWGFLYDEKNGTSEVAPVYDCGSCLLPQADEKVMRGVLEQKEMLHARVYQFPTSAIRLNGRKINYYDFLTQTNEKACIDALCRITPKVDLAQIKKLIEKTPFLTGLQKQFYYTYVKARYELLICPAYQRVK